MNNNPPYSNMKQKHASFAIVVRKERRSVDQMHHPFCFFSHYIFRIYKEGNEADCRIPHWPPLWGLPRSNST